MGVKEGDSPSFLHLIDNGLNVYDRPDWGGWGGKFDRECANQYTGGKEESISKYRQHFQNDFAARMDWAKGGIANHAPKVVVNGCSSKAMLEIEAGINNSVTMDASASTDPDGDQLTYHWYQDKVPDSYQQDVQITGAASAVARVEIPSDTDGKGIMIVLEVTDNGYPALTRYRRIMLHAGGDTDSVVPAAPTNLVATTASNSWGQYTFPSHSDSISAGQINLSWEDNSDNETIFRIEYKNGSGDKWRQIDVVGANVTTYTKVNLAESTTYYWRVRAYNRFTGNSSYSNEVSATTHGSPVQ